MFKAGNAENGNQIKSGLNADKERIYIFNSDGNTVDTVGYTCTDSERVHCGTDSDSVVGSKLQSEDASDPNSFKVIPPSPGQDTAGIQNAVFCAPPT